MNKTTSTTIATIIGIIIIVAAVAFFAKKPSSETTTETPITQNTVQGCYVASLAKDVYSMNIQSVQGEQVSGTLTFDNFEKDSSRGTFAGSYKDGILLADYRFMSEGTESVMQVIFKKTDRGFMRGFGEVTTEGDRVSFKDTSAIEYDPNQEFIQEPCA